MSALCLVQVQYAASEATRALLAAAHLLEEAAVLPVLLPAMCFNRHVSAEGLRTYSQATWERAMGNSGRAWVARCIAQVRCSALCIMSTRSTTDV